MHNAEQMPRTTDEQLEKFIESIPDPQQIRERIQRNARENLVLKRVLRLSETVASTTQREHAQ